MDPGDRTYRNQVIRLADLTVTSDVIEGVTFEHCQMIGPAVVALLGGTSMLNSAIDGDAAAVVWSVSRDRPRVIGAIALENCTVANCRLERIGFAVPEDAVEDFLRGIGG